MESESRPKSTTGGQKAWQMSASIAEGPGIEIPAFNHTHAVQHRLKSASEVQQNKLKSEKSLANACQHRRRSGNRNDVWFVNRTPSEARRPRQGRDARLHHLGRDTCLTRHISRPRPAASGHPRESKRRLVYQSNAVRGQGPHQSRDAHLQRKEQEVPVTNRREPFKAHTTYHTRVCHDYGLEGVF